MANQARGEVDRVDLDCGTGNGKGIPIFAEGIKAQTMIQISPQVVNYRFYTKCHYQMPFIVTT